MMMHAHSLHPRRPSPASSKCERRVWDGMGSDEGEERPPPNDTTLTPVTSFQLTPGASRGLCLVEVKRTGGQSRCCSRHAKRSFWTWKKHPKKSVMSYSSARCSLNLRFFHYMNPTLILNQSISFLQQRQQRLLPKLTLLPRHPLCSPNLSPGRGRA
jgi:hypothetical protein